MDNRKIGVFDSGVGGLTVFSEIIKQLPSEDIIYIGDTKRFPFGNKSKESIILSNTTSGTRTQTPLLEADLKSAAPANYAKVAKNVRYGIWTHVTALKGQCPIPLD